ncbi:outer membrane beta-barrel protein [Marinobacter caseinilyticus]|uniref:outer membrane beta-barrel protein n=1 Tax=Marinobacter caseinilyticus TaxID=2692195 RepID=UPI001409DEC7|nr:outer membrane beta-barrel protein [Marinobacter caseinilyticus]
MFKTAILAAAVTLGSMPAISEEMNEQKRFSVGIASFATVTRTETYFGTEDDDFSGFALFGTGAVNDNIAFRLTYASQSYEEDSNLDLTAVEGSLLAGTGLATQGFKAYGSLGFFDETLQYDGFSDEYGFNGLMLGGGIGYNWNPISLEFWINFRDASDYEDFAGGNMNVAAASGGLGLSARF